MGVGGLKTFIDEIPHLFERLELKGRVVIDGNGLCHYLHGENEIQGPYAGDVQGLYAGDYPQFEKSARHFFQILKDCDIEPHVVFDGAMDNEGRKWQTVKKRADTKLENVALISPGEPVYPLLTSETFRQVLNELKIQHVTCDFEGDAGCAALANHFKCPVMSADSDFFVFHLKAGYVPFDTLTFPAKTKTESRKTLKAKKYSQKRFLSQFGLRDKKMVPLFATLVGNDFVERKSFKHFFFRKEIPKEKTAKMNKLLEWLKSRETYEEACKEIVETFHEDVRSEKRMLIEESVELYTHLPQKLLSTGPEKPLSELRLPQESLLSDQFYKLIREGQVSRTIMDALKHGKFFLDTQVEQMKEDNTFQCSRPIRAATYAILLGPNTSWTIHEYGRVKGEKRFKEFDVTIRHVERGVVASLQTKKCLEPGEQRRSIILDILKIKHDQIKSIQDYRDVQLVLLTLMYWGKNTGLKMSECHLMAVLIALLVYQTPTEASPHFDTMEAASAARRHFDIMDTANLPYDKNLVHAFAQFQACFYDILHLNQLLESPYQSPSPARFYDGKLLHDLTRELKKRDNRASREKFVADGFNGDPTAFKTFQNLYGKLRAALPAKVFPIGFKLAPVAPKVPPSNRFELLELSD